MGKGDPIRNVSIEAINRDAANELDRRSHALDGFVILTYQSDFGGGAGVSPTGRYSGFIVSDDGATISAATFWDVDTNNFASTQSMASFKVTAGQYYPFTQGKTITLTAGAIMLFKTRA
jgi:hypothetical protein